MAKKGNLPDLIFVGAIGGGRNKVRHSHVVFEVLDFDANGNPNNLRLIQPDEIIDLRDAKDGERCFMTAYVQEQSLRPWNEGIKRAKK